MGAFKKPALPGNDLFEAQPADADPAERSAAGHRIATLLVRGPLDNADQQLVDRVLHLAESEGLSTIAELWAHASADSLAGALWRLYALRTWVYRQSEQAAREFAAGKRFSPIDEVLAGVVDPPGPAEVIELVDTVVRGIIGDDFDVTLDRAAAFAHLVGVGRAHLEEDDVDSAARLTETARALHAAAELERAGILH